MFREAIATGLHQRVKYDVATLNAAILSRKMSHDSILLNKFLPFIAA